MSFKESHVATFMGGEFKIPTDIKTAPQLKALFDSWSKEVAGWNDEKLSEVAIAGDAIHVTLETGITQ